MAERLSPQEADAALREMDERRNQVTRVPAPWPAVAVGCLLLVAFGVVLDQFPQASDWAGNALVAVAFGLMFLSRTRRFGSWLGYRVPPQRVRGAWGARLLALVLLVGGAVLLVVFRSWLVREGVAWPSTITYGGLGSALTVLVAAVMGGGLGGRPRKLGDGAE